MYGRSKRFQQRKVDGGTIVGMSRPLHPHRWPSGVRTIGVRRSTVRAARLRCCGGTTLCIFQVSLLSPFHPFSLSHAHILPQHCSPPSLQKEPHFGRLFGRTDHSFARLQSRSNGRTPFETRDPDPRTSNGPWKAFGHCTSDTGYLPKCHRSSPACGIGGGFGVVFVVHVISFVFVVVLTQNRRHPEPLRPKTRLRTRATERAQCGCTSRAQCAVPRGGLRGENKCPELPAGGTITHPAPGNPALQLEFCADRTCDGLLVLAPEPHFSVWPSSQCILARGLGLVFGLSSMQARQTRIPCCHNQDPHDRRHVLQIFSGEHREYTGSPQRTHATHCALVHRLEGSTAFRRSPASTYSLPYL